MAMEPARSKHLHNFTLPCLKWGSQRYLRCKKVNSDGGDVSGTDRRYPASKLDNLMESRRREPDSERRLLFNYSEKRSRASKSIIERSEEDDDGEVGIEAVREKLMFDLKTAADKMKNAILREDVMEEGEEEEEHVDVAEVETASQSVAVAASERMPWNLRTRRAACRAPIGSDIRSKPLKIEERKTEHKSPLKNEGGAKWPRPRPGPEKKETVKFAVSLSKKEIEEDFMELLGHRPPRRPKKRPRIVQRQLDSLFPGLWLTEITADSYKVPEFPENAKV